MKHKRTKKFIKLGILLFGISFVLFNCEKEDTNIYNQVSLEKRLSRISLNELNSNLGNSKDYDKLSVLFDVNNQRNDQYSQRSEINDQSWLITNEIVMIQKNNITFYTFKIGTDSTENEFYNLVVSVDEFGDILSMRTLQYIPSNDWLANTSQPFSGSVKLIENTTFSESDITDLLVARGSLNDCVVGLDYEYDCSYGEGHGPGDGLDCGPYDIIIIPVYGPCDEMFDAGDSGGGGGGFPIDTGNTGGGGGTSDDGSGNNNDDGNPPDDGKVCIVDSNGNCLSDDTAVIPPRDLIQDCVNEISGLSEIINTPKIKTELTRLKTSLVATAIEDGKRFIYTGPDPSNPATYNDANFDEILPTGKFPSSLDFPPLQNNILVGAHFHPFAGIDGKPIRQVPSGTDIAEHINMIKKVYATNPNAANQVTNFVVSKGNSGRTYILRANNAQNIVNNTLDYTIQKNRDKISGDVIEKLKPYRYDAFDEHEKAFNSFLTENFPDLDVLKAEYDANGNITKFCKLKTQQ